jgi:hypothetical protein
VLVIGCPAIKLNTFIPNEVVIELDNLKKCLLINSGIQNYDDTKPTRKVDLIMSSSQWIVIDSKKPVVIEKSEIEKWKNRRSEELVKEASGIKGNPLRVLDLLESAAKLKSFELSDFVRKLGEQRKDENESLEDLFLRVRGTPVAGQTGS